MKNFTKSQKKELRILGTKLYKIELEIELEKLHNYFQEWKSEKIDCFTLDRKIATYKRKASKLSKKYENLSYYNYFIARGVVDNLLKIKDVPDVILEEIKAKIEFVDPPD